MDNLLLNDQTRIAFDNFANSPSHALLIVAPSGMGKRTAALSLAVRLLETDEPGLINHPYFKSVSLTSTKSISIDAIRDVIRFMSLKSTGQGATSRIVVIENAQLMTAQAQNALLKTIEEPPVGTVLILTAPSEVGILPTIRSRVQVITIFPPSGIALTDYFKSQGYTTGAIEKAIAMSDGLPGLTKALLESDATHPLVVAASSARIILQKSSFERLLMIDDLAKDKEAWINILFILGRMADVALRKATTAATANRWRHILTACHEAESQTLSSGQPKLVALNFMLSL